MEEYQDGDRIRVDIPDIGDPDHDRLHGYHGEIIDTVEDAAGEETGDDRDSVIYRVELDSGDVVDLRWRDIRPPIE